MSLQIVSGTEFSLSGYVLNNVSVPMRGTGGMTGVQGGALAQRRGVARHSFVVAVQAERGRIQPALAVLKVVSLDP
jgi:hypothetical protein